MEYRRFGRTEINMPVFTCGGMRFQQSWEDKSFDIVEKENQRNLEHVIERALQLGINHIETARGYGTSEIQLGKILPTIKRDSIILQTKVAPSAEYGEFTRNFEKSLTYLQLDSVDLLSIHGINNDETYEWSLKKRGVLYEARKLQEQGLCKFIGFSTHGPTDIILKAVKTNEFDYVNLHWYYIFQNHWSVILEANKLDMGVFIISPNDKGGRLYEPSQKLVDLCKPLSPMAFNDLFCLAKQQIHTLSLGVSQPSDFDEHINALQFYNNINDTIAPLTNSLNSELDTIKNKLGFDYWNSSIVPTWENIPGGINVQMILWLWSLINAFDLIKYSKERYNLFGNGGHWFQGQKVDLEALKKIHTAIKNEKICSKITDILLEIHTLLDDIPKERLSKSD